MADRPKNVGDVLKMMKDKEVKFLDLRFTDTKGKMQHVTADGSCVNEGMFADGYAFDGSSIAGWKGIEASDMTLMPDPTSAHLDPFFAQTTMAVFCDVLEPSTGEMYERDPRSIAKRAEAYLKQTGIGDTVVFGPEAEFFIFDDMRYTCDPYNMSFRLDSAELPSNSGTDYEMGNLGHRPRTKGGYFPVPPVDSAQDIRSEMLSVMAEMGVIVEKHHHEVASAQHELGIKFGPMVQLADAMQIYKYVCQNVAQAYGKTVCFMPKPVYGDNGSGMHCHQSIWKGSTPVFAGNKYADLSDTVPQLHRRHPQARPHHQRLHQPDHQLLQAAGAGLRGPRAAGLLRAQPLGVVPHSRGDLAEGQARRGALPRSRRQPVSGLCRHADGRPRRHPEQDQPRRSGGQEPLRPAAGGALEDPDRVRDLCARPRQPRQEPRLPEEGRRLLGRHDRRLPRAQDGRGRALRDDPAPGRVRYVLLGIAGREQEWKGGPVAALFAFPL
jgi:hypothetical protein